MRIRMLDKALQVLLAYRPFKMVIEIEFYFHDRIIIKIYNHSFSTLIVSN